MLTATDKEILLAALLSQSEKAWRSGGGMGASSGLGGHGGHGVSKPGSRGGHPWTDASGNVRYGPQPKGGRSGSSGNSTAKKPVAYVGHTSSARIAANRARARAAAGQGKKPLSKLQQRHRMLSEMDRAIKTGKDPHGNKLSDANIQKLRFLATSLRTDLKTGAGAGTKAIKEQIDQVAKSRMPFTVFKDKSGQYRWVGVSSSAAQDGDGETVSLKALQEDTALKDVTGDYGPLNWWHTPIRLGTCDFNAMDGPLLVESGTFESPGVAVAVSKAIAEKSLEPGMSLEFEHNEPGPPVLPGRVFTRINKVGRALLPAEKASNLLTSFKVYSLKSAGAAWADAEDKDKDKESKKMLTEEKLKKLESIMPPELLSGLLEGNQTAVKMAEAANYSFKAMAPAVEAPAAPVVEAAPAPAAPVEVAASVVAEPPAQVATPAVVEAAPVETEETTEEEGEPIDAEALFESLTKTITASVLAGITAQQATSTKEVSDTLAGIALALKENATAFEKVLGENKSLKARLDALEGLQPAAVRARASQGAGLTADQLPEVHKEIVNPANQKEDPYAKIIADLGLTMAPRA